MKKENRKMAMERKAKEREAKEQRKKRRKILSVAIPAAVVVILIAVITADSISRNSSSSSTTTDTSSSETETENVLLTDSSLTVANGDIVNIDYVGTIDGVEFSGGSTDGTGVDLIIGSGTYIDDFEDQLIGSHPGDEVEVTVTFPEDYGNVNLNGQEAVFAVTVHGIYQ